ncbi:Hypothetical protein RG1141_PB01310 (plasmid) [Neorhizobium galegae bv. officinalis bv. officinalis str. HAMBI 1141]|uniref:Uncharacterized protein n=1 Tax=Neorhizobium galegae bv. officinalis bv. officinalis str. HAMBI 1141 TaxID=1028801 RepID=A0A068TK11_NEOGA|nr:Hypothetical protein RG1141_PB01310 [Neorhizobium galegae bv. officinalis bv. officinalis str. HAMBI 1141]
MIEFKPNRAASSPSEPARSALPNSAVEVEPVPDVISVEADGNACSIPAPLELSSDLPPRKPAKRRPAALKKPRAIERLDADTAPLMLNLDP